MERDDHLYLPGLQANLLLASEEDINSIIQAYSLLKTGFKGSPRTKGRQRSCLQDVQGKKKNKTHAEFSPHILKVKQENFRNKLFGVPCGTVG